MFRRIHLLAFGFIFVAPLPVFAAAIPLFKSIVPKSCYEKAGGCQTICALAEAANNALFDANILIVFAVAVWLMIAGWGYVTAGIRGETIALGAAKQRLTRIALAVGVILIAWLAVNLILSIIAPGSSLLKFC